MAARCSPRPQAGLGGDAGSTLRSVGMELTMGPGRSGPGASPGQSPADIHERHRRRSRVGEVVVHWGLRDVQKPDPGPGYGARATQEPSVAEMLRQGQKVGVAEYKDSVSEAVYESVRREPLGKGWVRGHELPLGTKDPAFVGFGKATVMTPIADAISPRGPVEELRPVPCGAAPSRSYAWPAAVGDPQRFPFGRANVLDPGGMRAALGGEQPPTTIGSARAEQFRAAASYQLASPRNFHLPLPPTELLDGGHAFGKATGDAPTCRELVHGGDAAAALPDLTLGRSGKNQITHKPFGMPSARFDRVAPPPEKRSVTSTTNWGDEYGVPGVLAPTRYGPSDFDAPHTAVELRELIGASAAIGATAGTGIATMLPGGMPLDDVVEAALRLGGASNMDGVPTATLHDVSVVMSQLMSPR